MDLLEYQAKDLFKGVSIPTLPSQLITHVGEVKNLNLNYPLMLKSQVKSGGRAKAGGIRYVDNTIDAIAQTQAILNLPIWGEYPQLIMAEAHYPTYQEVFLAVVMDYWLGKPMLLGSKMGGTEIEPLLANLQQVVVDRPFSCYLAKKLTIMMGLEPELIPKVAALLSKMYGLFAKFDLDLIEINPLGIDHEGNLMALDGKVRINEAAWHRQLDYFQPTETTVVEDLLPIKPLLLEPVWTGHEEDGLVIIGNTMGLGMMAWDLAIAKKIPLNSCFVLEQENLVESLTQLLISLEQESSPGMTLLYLWGNEKVEAQVRKALAIYATQINPGPSMLPQGLSWLSQENLIICCPDTWSLKLGDKQEFKIEQVKDLGVAFEKVARAYEIMA